MPPWWVSCDTTVRVDVKTMGKKQAVIIPWLKEMSSSRFPPVLVLHERLRIATV